MKKININWARILTNWTIILLIGFTTVSLIGPQPIDSITIPYSFILSGITVLVLIMTLNTYKDLLKVSERTLSFTKTQTSLDSYYNKYKLFDDLSKREIRVGTEIRFVQIPDNLDLTFDNIQTVYVKLLTNFTVVSLFELGKVNEYKAIFSKINSKFQSFIDLVNKEICFLKKDEHIDRDQKQLVIDLYKNFILADYLIISKDLNEELKKKETQPTYLSDLLQSISNVDQNNNLDFNPEVFLSLYYEVEKPIEKIS
jgi:hypothetical protein